MSKVIACIDGTSVTPAVCDGAAWAGLRLDAPLVLLHVLEKARGDAGTNLSGSIGLGSREALLQELASLDEKRARLALEEGRIMLAEARERVLADGVAEPEILQRHGSLVETLAELEPEMRLVVLGKHDEHLHEHVGSRLETAVRTLHRPILITTSSFSAPTRVMIAFDGSETTRKVVDMVARSPLLRGLPLHLVLVGGDEARRAALEAARAQLAEAGFEVQTAVLEGEVEQSLCGYRADHDIDLLVMGAYGHSVIRRFLVGSTTTSVVRDAKVTVLLLR